MARDQRANERPGRQTVVPLTLTARWYPPKLPLARLAERGAGALVRFIGGVLANWRCRRQRAAAIRELRAWNDWMLKDIGLTRGEIIAAVDGRLERGGRRSVAPVPTPPLEGPVESADGGSNGKKPDAAARSPDHPTRGPAPLQGIEERDRRHEGTRQP